MAIFHVNPATGEPGECSAADGNCPYGGSVDEHFTSKAAAREAFENTQDALGSSSVKRKKTTKLPKTLAVYADKLPAELQERLANLIEESETLVSDADSGRIETRYESINNFLEPPVHALRARGEWFEEPSEIDIDDPGLLIAIHSRQGGGNRDCYCDDYDNHDDHCLASNNNTLENHPSFVATVDDEGDSTYSTHYFRGFTAADAEKHKEQSALAHKVALARSTLERLKLGEEQPWSLLDPQEAASARSDYSLRKQARDRILENLQRAEPEKALALKGLSAAQNGDELSEDEFKKIGELATGNGYNRDYQARQFAVALRSSRSATEAFGKARARMDEAEALPPGELRSYLVDDRGDYTYNTTEGTGRKKRTVVKTAKRGSLLGEELDREKRSLESANKSLQPYLEKLQEKVDRVDTLKTDLQAEELKVTRARDRAWLAGWPDDVPNPPTVSDKF